AGATYGPAGAVIADVTPPEKRAATFGLLGAAFGIGFIIGPALGGLVAGLGPRAPFIAAGILAMINAVLMLLFLPETLAPENRRPFRLRAAHVIGAFRPLFHAGNAAPLLLVWFLRQLASTLYPPVWALSTAMRFRGHATDIRWGLAWVGLLSVIVQMGLTGRVVRRFGEHGAAMLGLAAAAACLLAYAFTWHAWQVYAFFLVGALGALAYPALSGILSRMVDASRQ